MHTPHDLFFDFTDLLVPLRLIRSANLQVHHLAIFVAIYDILGNSYQVLIRNLMTLISSSIFLMMIFFIWFEGVEIVLQLLHRWCYLATILTVRHVYLLLLLLLSSYVL